MKLKKVMAVALSLILLVSSLTACGSSSDNNDSAAPSSDKVVTMRIGTGAGGIHFIPKTMEEFKRIIDEKSGGRIEVQLYPAGQLGNLAQLIQGMQDGSISSGIFPSAYYSTAVADAAIIDLPFFIESSDQAYRIFNDNDTKLEAKLEQNGFVPLAWLRSPDRVLISNKNVQSINDLNKLITWTLPSPIIQDELISYGATPSNLDMGELAVSIQNGTVDAAFSDTILFSSQKLHVSAPYLLMAPNDATAVPFMVSKIWWDTVPSDLQEIIKSSAIEAIENFEYDYLEELLNSGIENMKAEGLTVIEPNQQLLDNMKEAAMPLQEKFLNKNPNSKEVFDELAALIEADRNR
jgi:TRAP-type C4-dicarboxylate transport system substrate-binding protein